MTDQGSFGLAFLAGLVSFLSPCVLPLVPSYVTYLTGASVEELREGVAVGLRRKVLLNAFTFVSGFSLVFIAFGLTSSVVGQFLGLYTGFVRRVSGVLIIFMGLYMMGMLHFLMLERERRWNVPESKASPVKSFLVGATFSAGWTPCIGPILTAILVVAANGETATFGGWLLGMYALGLGLPFLATAFSLSAVSRLLKQLGPYLKHIRVASGLLLVVMGVMVYTNYFFVINAYVNWRY